MDVKFYYVNANYIEFLKKYEYNVRNFNSVPNVEYANNNKFFYGTVLKKNGINYYVPISHDINSSPNSMVMITKPRRTKDKPFKLGTLKFLYMIPVPNNQLIELNVNDIKDSDRRRRVIDELAYCNRNREKIFNQAQKTYDIVIATESQKLKRNSCDFKLLEEAYREFCGLAEPKQDQSKTVEVTQHEVDKTLDAVIEILDETIAEKNEAISERNKAIAERDEALAEFKKFRSEAMANSEEFNAIMKENPALKAAFKAARERHLESKDQKPTMPDKSAPNDTQTIKPKKPKR